MGVYIQSSSNALLRVGIQRHVFTDDNTRTEVLTNSVEHGPNKGQFPHK